MSVWTDGALACATTADADGAYRCPLLTDTLGAIDLQIEASLVDATGVSEARVDGDAAVDVTLPVATLTLALDGDAPPDAGLWGTCGGAWSFDPADPLVFAVFAGEAQACELHGVGRYGGDLVAYGEATVEAGESEILSFSLDFTARDGDVAAIPVPDDAAWVDGARAPVADGGAVFVPVRYGTSCAEEPCAPVLGLVRDIGGFAEILATFPGADVSAAASAAGWVVVGVTGDAPAIQAVDPVLGGAVSTTLPGSGSVWSLASDPADPGVVYAVVDDVGVTVLHALAIGPDGSADLLFSTSLPNPTDAGDLVDAVACDAARCVSADGDSVLVHGHGSLWVVDAATGDLRRRVDVAEGAPGAALVGGEVAWIDATRVRRITPDTGAAVPGWPARVGPSAFSLTSDGDDLYVGVAQDVIKLGPTGAITWQVEVGADVVDVAVDGAVALVAGAGRAILLEDGEVSWSEAVTPGQIYPLLLDDDAALVLSQAVVRLDR